MKALNPTDRRRSAPKAIYSTPDLDGHHEVCPYRTAKPELCLAALASSMIDKRGCSSQGHKDCAIFLLVKSGS